MQIKQIFDQKYYEDNQQKQEKVSAYRDELINQIQEKKKKQRDLKEREKQDDIRHLREYDHFFKFEGKLWQTQKRAPVTDLFGRQISQSQSPNRNFDYSYTLPTKQNSSKLLDLYPQFGIKNIENSKEENLQPYSDLNQQKYSLNSQNLKSKSPEFDMKYKIDEYYQLLQQKQPIKAQTRQEALHMKPTNNFEEITEEEFERRERKKAEYRNELMQQIREQQEKKHNLKKQDMLNEVKHEQRIYKQLHEMQQEYISDEIKKGNTDVKSRIQKIDMIPPLNEEDAINSIQRNRDRSRSKSKSPDTRKLAEKYSSPVRQQLRYEYLQHRNEGEPLQGIQKYSQMYQNPYQNNYHFEEIQNKKHYQPNTDLYNYQIPQRQPELSFFDERGQLDRLSKLQEHIQNQYKQSQIDNLSFEKQILF